MGDSSALLPAVAGTPKSAGRPREARTATEKTERAPDKLSATGRSFAILEHVALAQTPVDVVDIIGIDAYDGGIDQTGLTPGERWQKLYD